MNEFLSDPLRWLLLMQAVLVIGLIWILFKQSRLLRHQEEERQWTASGFDRMQELQREQERSLLSTLGSAGEGQRQAAELQERRVLLQVSRLYQALERRFGEMQKHLADDSGNLRVDLTERHEQLQQALERMLGDNRVAQHEGFSGGMERIGRQLMEGLEHNAKEVGGRVDKLTQATDSRLREISGQVDKGLNEGFERTAETFSRVLAHLSRIDEAQKRITELSNNVVSLQEVLADKRSRGAFGEVQLNALVSNLMPDNSFALQHTLSNGSRVDCMLFLPPPTGNLAIDAKFPLENFRRMTDIEQPDGERAKAAQLFRRDIRTHIAAIADKYIIEPETASGAMMFIPAESVFAEIHGHHPELVEEAWRRHVWMASPTTMMAILTTARAALKDAATREQIDLIQQHLRHLARDFDRFQVRMEKLSRHIKQAGQDVEDAQRSARKIGARFERIERVELDDLPPLDES